MFLSFFLDTAKFTRWIIHSPDGETLQETLHFVPLLRSISSLNLFHVWSAAKMRKYRTKNPCEWKTRIMDPQNTKYRLFMVCKGLWYTVATLGPLKFCFRFKLFCFSFFLFYFLNNIFCFSFHLPFIQFILNFWMATIGYHITSSRRIPQGYVLSHLRKTLIDLPWPLKERGSQNNAMFRSC